MPHLGGGGTGTPPSAGLPPGERASRRAAPSPAPAPSRGGAAPPSGGRWQACNGRAGAVGCSARLGAAAPAAGNPKAENLKAENPAFSYVLKPNLKTKPKNKQKATKRSSPEEPQRAGSLTTRGASQAQATAPQCRQVLWFSEHCINSLELVKTLVKFYK